MDGGTPSCVFRGLTIMAYKLISGHGGTHLVMNYAQTALVSMESPCPYAQWDVVPVSTFGNGTLTNGTAFAKVTHAGSLDEIFGAYFRFKMLYTGSNTLTFTITKGAGSSYGASNISVEVEGSTIGSAVTPSVGTPANLAVPYYRYTIYVLLQGATVSAGASDAWVNVAVTLS